MPDEPTDMEPVAESLPAQIELDQSKLAKLAREIAMNIRDLPAILASFGISQSQYDNPIKSSPFFKRALELYTTEWESALSTAQRLKVQSATALEYSLPNLAVRMNSTEETLPAAVETAKLFAKIAGVGERDGQPASGERFTITINLGADQQLKFERDVTPTKTVDELPAIEPPEKKS